MAYIGRGLDKLSNVDVLDAITFTDSAGPYNITKSSTAFIPSAIQNLLIEVDGVIQASASYTITGSTITFGVSMSSSSTMNSFIHFGMGVSMTPTDGSVSTAKIVDDAVTTAKILDNNVTVAKLPTTLNISSNTVTLPASVSGLATGITNAQLAGSITDAKITGLSSSKLTGALPAISGAALTALNATNIGSGTVPTARLGSGSASSSTYLAGDQTYKSITAVDIAWQSVVTGSTLTAVAGNGYWIDTTSNACVITLPSSASNGDQIIFADYARYWGTNGIEFDSNGLNYQGQDDTYDVEYGTDGMAVHIVYSGATKGWIPTLDKTVADVPSKGNSEGIFGYGDTSGNGSGISSMTNLVSNVGVVAADVTGVGTARSHTSACEYGGDKGIMGYGTSSPGTKISVTNLISNAGVVAE